MPPVKCGTCAKFISPPEAARCGTCNAHFHRTCGLLPVTGTISPTWTCSDCKNKNKGRIDSVTYEFEEFADANTMDDTHTLNPDISRVLRDFKEALQADLRTMFKEELRAELHIIRKEFQSEFQRLRADLAQVQADRDQLMGSIKSCNERMDSLEIKIGTLEANIVTPSSESMEEITQLRRELNDRDQQLLSNDIEISNIPETNNENLTHTIKLISTKLGVNLELRDVVSVERTGGRQVNATSAAGAVETRPRPIVVRLARRDLRDDLMRAARVRRASTKDLDMTGPPRRFYINERLTKINRQLFRRAREAGQRFGWNFVWTKHGRILARHKPDDKASLIRNEADLLRVFGSEA